jgi:hypothetical protein
MVRFSIRYLTGIIAAGMLTQSCITSTSPEDIAQEAGGGYTVLAKLRSTGYAQDVIVVDSFAYIAQGQGGIAIADVGDPRNPKVLSELLYEVPGYSRKVAYTKDSTGTEVIYSADGGYGVASVDVTDKLHPRVPKGNLGFKPAVSLFVFKNFLCVMENANGMGITLFSDPKYPEMENKVDFSLPGFGRGACMSSDSAHALLAIGEGGFIMLNFAVTAGEVSDTLSGRLDLPGTAEDIAIKPGTSYAFLACGPAGLQVVDYADTAHVKRVGSFAAEGFAMSVCVAGETAYLATQSQGVQMIDISDVTSPRRIGMVKTKDVRGVDVRDGYVYAADRYEGLIIIKIP